MQAPTWEKVGIPNNVTKAIKVIPQSFLLDCLVYQLVFHVPKRITPTYLCNHCGHSYIPNRSSEEVAQCGECEKKQVRCIQSLKFGPDRKVPLYSRASKNLPQIINQMNHNFISYFKNHPGRNMDWEWHNNQFHVAFAGGDTANDPIPRIAVARAAVLTPYLWDSYFDWKDNCVRETIEQKFISHLLQLVPPKRE